MTTTHDWQVEVSKAIQELTEAVRELNPGLALTFDLDHVILAPQWDGLEPSSSSRPDR